jgi:tight adherence protein C
MDAIFSLFGDMFSDSNTLLVAVLVFLAAGTLAFSLMAVARVRGSVKRRTSRLVENDKRTPSRSLRHSSLKAVARLIEYTNKHYANADDGNMKVHSSTP